MSGGDADAGGDQPDAPAPDWHAHATPEERERAVSLERVMRAGEAARAEWLVLYNRCKKRQARAPRDVKGVKPPRR